MIVALQTLVFFRESFFTALDRLLRPYYKQLTLSFSRNSEDEECEEEEQVFAEFDDEKGVVFYPPMYSQRYAAVSDCLMDERWCGQLEKVVDLGYHDMSFIKYLKEVPGVKRILGVDIESIPLRCSSELLGGDDYAPKRESPLQVTLFEGNAADPDFRLIGCDAIVGIEMIEHMLPHDLDRLVHTVFGFVKPWIVIFTTPNADFNVLFKALEKNGLRRLDHFFEWSREQFHDWCSNIVIRYPQYTVSCKGVGPGPFGTIHYGCCSQLALFVNKDYHKQQDLNINSLALVAIDGYPQYTVSCKGVGPGPFGTIHYGCCSQLALFVNKNYHKQQDLNINSLALVANVPSPTNITEMVAGWASPTIENKMLWQQNNVESLSEILYSPTKNSCVTIVITSDFSNESLEYQDKTSQCNLETEIGKNFLMFDDEEMCFSVVVPRRKLDGKVYEIEDVNCRLNCTTCQVKKFSKTTQNLMAKNKIDSLVHTREVVDEIRHLTKMLNFNKRYFYQGGDGKHIWYNINWGENAPYWNQYYKIVRDYNYPFETKSDECRILDLISEEINRLIDIQYDEEFSVDVNKLEIPMEHLMRVVSHITDDAEKVKDLLEWNGYEIINNVVIHSRLVVDNTSIGSHEEDWLDNESISDCDTMDVHSTSLSDGSSIVPDYHGRCLRRALDRKVRALRTMLSADDDITTELDHVVCRLMKLALKSSKGKQTPPPARWMQCKLLDLLTLTEKSISRRKRYFIENFPLNAIGFGEEESVESIGLSKLNTDDTAAKTLLEKYENLIQLPDTPNFLEVEELIMGEGEFTDIPNNFEAKECLMGEGEFTEFGFTETGFSDEPENGYVTYESGKVYKPVILVNGDDSGLDPTVTWVEEDTLALVPYPDNKSAVISSSDHSTSFGARYIYKKRYKTFNNHAKNFNGSNYKQCKRSHSKIFDNYRVRNTKDDKKGSDSKTNLPRKDRRRNAVDYGKYGLRSKKKVKERKKLQPTPSNPIPGSLIELCHPGLTADSVGFNFPTKKGKYNVANESKCNHVSATKESFLISIIMDDMEETIALRRSIGTDADMEPTVCEQEVLMESALNVETNDSLNNMHHIATENVHSQTIFLYDINEPSTSKGVRHLSTDVQCGPDTQTPCFATVTPAHSVPRIPKLFSTGFKVRDSLTNLATAENTSDFGTSTNIENFGPTSPRLKFSNLFKSGIKIKDSSENVTAEKKSINFGSTVTNDYSVDTSVCMFTSGIKIGVSSNDFTVKTCLDTCTDHDNTIIPKMEFDVRKNKTESCTFTDQEHHIIDSSMVGSTKIKRKNDTKHSLGNVTTKSSNEKYRTISPTARPIGIKLKDSDTNFSKKVECGTTTRLDVMSDIKTPYASTTETKLLIPISSGIIEDSCSEFCGSGYSATSPLQDTNLTKNSSVRQSKLSCGGIHIHSYKEKQVSEDVVFQGKWLRYKAKAHTRKKPYNPVTVRKVTDPTVKKIKNTNSKHKISVKEAQMKAEVEIKPVRKPLPVKPKSEPVKKEQINNAVFPYTVVKTNLSNRNITKVASKMAMSTMLAKNTKCTRFAKKTSIVPLAEVKKDVSEQKKLLRKSYLPLYLKKHQPILDKNSLNQSLDSVQIVKELQKPKSKGMLPLTMSDPEEIKSCLIKFCDEPQENISYVVFRNEIENQNRSATDCHTTDNNARKKNCTSRRSSSPASQNSSTCSTPDSIATVRAVTTRSRASTRRHSTSSNKSSLGNTESETTTPVRNRKFTKRGKNTKKSDEKDHDKENKPESSKKYFSNRDLIKIEKSAFKGRNKNVYMARVTNDASPSYNNDKLKQNQTANKSFIRIPTADSKDDVEKKKRPLTASDTHKTSIIKSSKPNCVVLSEEKQSHENINPNKLQPVESYNDHINVEENISQIQQNTCEIQKNIFQIPQNTSQITQNTFQIQESTPEITTNNSISDSKVSDINVIEDNILSQWLDSSSQSLVVSSAESSILAAMKLIVEERLDFIEQSSPKYYDLSNSDQLNLALEELNKNMEDTLSLSSFKTAMTYENDFNNTLKSDNEEYNITFNTTPGDDSLQSLLDITPPTNDLDLLSFKSLTSVSRYSELFLVDCQHSEPTQEPPAITSLKEIFERKDQQIVQPNPPGPLAIQAFSGFSMNGAPVAGDQPGYVNLVDSETGSIAAEFTRQVTSEEVFVSGRSSSYESCVIDEDADIVVPNWLFQIINQHHLADEEPPQQQQLLPMPMPALLPHEQFDMNGNVVDGLGVAAGAGDGRGMHSDHSQDSSGRGTSLSSSDTSSGQQSEAILIEPSAFTAQFELMHDPSGSSIAVTTLVVPIDAPDYSFRAGEGPNIQNEMGTSRNAARNNPLLAASDVDADVSSLETDDVPDSSDN